jgi:hypothetical protein
MARRASRAAVDAFMLVRAFSGDDGETPPEWDDLLGGVITEWASDLDALIQALVIVGDVLAEYAALVDERPRSEVLDHVYEALVRAAARHDEREA